MRPSLTRAEPSQRSTEAAFSPSVSSKHTRDASAARGGCIGRANFSSGTNPSKAARDPNKTVFFIRSSKLAAIGHGPAFAAAEYLESLSGPMAQHMVYKSHLFAALAVVH